MEAILDELTGIVAVICSLGIPIVVLILVFLRKMKKDRQAKEIRQLIIENKTDPETAKLLIDEPKEAEQPRQMGPFNLANLRAACVLLGLGLGALVNWALEPFGFGAKDINFWIILAFGIGVGLLCSFLIEMRLYKKYGNQKPDEEPSAEKPNPAPEQ